MDAFLTRLDLIKNIVNETSHNTLHLFNSQKLSDNLVLTESYAADSETSPNLKHVKPKSKVAPDSPLVDNWLDRLKTTNPHALRIVNHGSEIKSKIVEEWEHLHFVPMGKAVAKPRGGIAFAASDARLKALAWDMPKDAVFASAHFTTTAKTIRFLLVNNTYGVFPNIRKRDLTLFHFSFRAFGAIFNQEGHRKVHTVVYIPGALPPPPAQVPESVRYVNFVFLAPAGEASRGGRTSYWAFLLFDGSSGSSYAFLPHCCHISRGQLQLFQRYLQCLSPKYVISDAGLRYAHDVDVEEESQTFRHDCGLICDRVPFPGHWHHEVVFTASPFNVPIGRMQVILIVMLGYLSLCPAGADHVQCILSGDDCSNGCGQRLGYLKESRRFGAFVRHSLGRSLCFGRFVLTDFLAPAPRRKPITHRPRTTQSDIRPTSPAYILPIANRFDILGEDDENTRNEESETGD